MKEGLQGLDRIKNVLEDMNIKTVAKNSGIVYSELVLLRRALRNDVHIRLAEYLESLGYGKDTSSM